MLKDLAAHLQDLDGLVPAPAPRRLPLTEILGLTLAEDVETPTDLPAFASSAMDGYAVRVGDVPGSLQVTGDVPAGRVPTVEVTPGTAVRVMTGALIPEGTEAVVPIEVTTGSDSAIEVSVGTVRGAYVRPAGSDAAAGTRVLDQGTVITAARIAVLASVGAVSPLVRPVPRVLVVSTGDELVGAGTAPGPAQLVDSNRPALLAAVAEAGCTAVDGGLWSDRVEGFLELLLAHDADLVVTTGGVSVGAYDVVKAALLPLGTVTFERVAIQPGMPQAWGHLPGGTPFLGLPGNPVSALVSWELFGRAALGRSRPRTRMRLAEAIDRSPVDKHQLLRVRCDADQVHLVGGTGSHLLAALARADALAIIPAGITSLPAGSEVEVVALGGTLGP